MSENAIDPMLYRTVLGTFPTGVTVVAGIDGDAPVGLAIGSFFSVSLDPALIGFCVDKGSGSWPRIEASGSFCVNILAADQGDVCGVFASKSDDKFADVSWQPSKSGSPLIANVLSWIDCSLHSVVDAGDHVIVLGDVQALAKERDDVDPLVFHAGRFPTFVR